MEKVCYNFIVVIEKIGKRYLNYNKYLKEGKNMGVIVLIYLLILIIFALIAFSIFQLKLAGIKVKDFWGFIQANEMLDKLYVFSKKYKLMSPQEQIIFLSEAEKVFSAFDKIPNMVWEDEYRKYSQVVDTYKNIRVARWNQQNTSNNE